MSITNHMSFVIRTDNRTGVEWLLYSFPNLPAASAARLPKLQPPAPSNCRRCVWNLARAGR